MGKNDIDSRTKRSLLRTMVRIREFEDSVGEMHLRGLTAGSMLHLSVGEEAIAAGIGLAMQEGDVFTTHHRGHGIFIARGGEMNRMMAEIFGKSDGYCRGKGGSMHIADVHYGHLGANAIVGGNIAIAMGGGFTQNYRKTSNVSVAFFGDGALNQGVLYESMNMAALWDLPVMFAVVNNQYGMGTRIDRASASQEFVKRGESFGLRSLQVDGMDVEAVYQGANRLFEHSRSGKGPTFFICDAYRFYGHGRKDPSPYREKNEEKKWWDRDPIPAYKDTLISADLISDADYQEDLDAAKAEVADAVEFAKNSQVPEENDLYTYVYVDPIDASGTIG
ncbi:MAG: hypothetical protein K9L68_00220 [Spirochaetales bacterium]|nr:hypothetical protein [Spirochaetales bacterium]MCF7937002.1 hypothetical protein [Spirochaetales bacterium]